MSSEQTAENVESLHEQVRSATRHARALADEWDRETVDLIRLMEKANQLARTATAVASDAALIRNRRDRWLTPESD